MIVDVFPQPLDSESSNETDRDISKQTQPKNNFREYLQKYRRLEQTKPSYKLVQSPISYPSSIIDVKVPYVDDAPTSVRPYEDPTTTDQKPVSICTDEPHFIHQWTESLTFRRDNYVHFISEDCEPTNPIAKLLMATERLDLQDLWRCRPKMGQVLVTPHGGHKTYSVSIKTRHVKNVDWKDVAQGLETFKLL